MGNTLNPSSHGEIRQIFGKKNLNSLFSSFSGFSLLPPSFVGLYQAFITDLYIDLKVKQSLWYLLIMTKKFDPELLY